MLRRHHRPPSFPLAIFDFLAVSLRHKQYRNVIAGVLLIGVIAIVNTILPIIVTNFFAFLLAFIVCSFIHTMRKDDRRRAAAARVAQRGAP